MPISDKNNRRVENRLPGADSNPYLAIAGSLAAKKTFKKDADGETLIFLPHDPVAAAGYLADENGRLTFQLAP